MKTVYSFDPSTRVYAGPVVLDETDLSPLEEGVYLVPGNCLTSEPPEVPPGFLAVAQDEEWTLMAVAASVGPSSAMPPTAEQVRAQRSTLLGASDWTQLLDVPNATRQAWAAYRQALRDITSQKGFPQSVEWPSAPVERQEAAS